jgi:hypothetical protein
MEWVQKRKWFTPTTTISQLWLGVGSFAEYACFTLEDLTRTAGEAKVPDQTAIPYGRYRISLTWSEKFQRTLPLFWNTQLPDGSLIIRSADGKIEFRGVRLHTGNKAEDTEGCVLPGLVRRPDNLQVLESKKAFDWVYPRLVDADARKEAIWWTIEAAPQAIHL